MDRGYAFRELTNTKNHRPEERHFLSGLKSGHATMESRSEKKPVVSQKRFDKSLTKLDASKGFPAKEDVGSAYNPRGLDVGACEQVFGVDDLFLGFCSRARREHNELGYLSGQSIEEEFAVFDRKMEELEAVLKEQKDEQGRCWSGRL